MENKAEKKFLLHLHRLHRRMAKLEENKRMKPLFSQAVDRLNDKIVGLLDKEIRKMEPVVKEHKTDLNRSHDAK